MQCLLASNTCFCCVVQCFDVCTDTVGHSPIQYIPGITSVVCLLCKSYLLWSGMDSVFVCAHICVFMCVSMYTVYVAQL
jgi:hypothetical protein